MAGSGVHSFVLSLTFAFQVRCVGLDGGVASFHARSLLTLISLATGTPMPAAGRPALNCRPAQQRGCLLHASSLSASLPPSLAPSFPSSVSG